MFNKPVLVPESDVTSLGSAIFAFLAAGVFQTVEEAQAALCPRHRTVQPDPAEAAVYQRLFEAYRQLYFGLGQSGAAPVAAGGVLRFLREIAAR